MARSLFTTALIVGTAGAALAACGSKDDTADSGTTDVTGTGTGAATGTGAPTGTGTGTTTGTGTGGTGTGTGTATGGPKGFVRAVNLLVEWPAIDVLSNGSLLIEDFPMFGNTDAVTSPGLGDWAEFPPQTYTVGAADPETGDELVSVPGIEVAADEHYTIVYHGSAFLESMYPGLGLGLDVTRWVDPPNDAGAGEHHLNVVHYNPFIDGVSSGVPCTVTIGASSWPLNYTQSSGAQVVPSGATTIDLEWTGDGTVDATYSVTLADASWSNLYLLPFDADGDPYKVPETFMMIHHVFATDNAPVFPSP